MDSAVETPAAIVAIETVSQYEGFCATAKLFFALDGNATFTFDNHTVRLGKMGVLAINRGTEYSYLGSEDLILASLDLTGRMFEDACDGMLKTVECDSSREDGERHTQLRALLSQMIVNQAHLRHNQRVYSHLAFEQCALYYKLLETIVNSFVPDAPASDLRSADSADANRRGRIEHYLNIHYAEAVTLEDLAKELYLSKGYLSRFFTKSFGVSFNHYIRELRLKRAMGDLLYTDKPITKISFDNGFSSSSYFNRAFREKYGASPSEVREQELTRAIERKLDAREQAKLDERVNRILEERTEPTAPPLEATSYTCNVTANHPVDHCWDKVVNVGSAADILKTDIQDHVRKLKEQIGFKYARFWNPFSHDLLLDLNSNQDTFNFLRLDNVIDSLLKIGLKPFIVFEPKPDRINETLESFVVRDQQEHVIRDAMTWKNLIDAFVKHLVNQYGTAEVETWIFELPADGYEVEGLSFPDSYLLLFEILQEAATKYANNLKVGGPMLPPNDERVPHILRGFATMKQAPDYVSMMSFAYALRKDIYRYSHRNGDEDHFHRDVLRMRMAADKAGLGDTPIYATEWNESITDKNYLNDTCYRGAYIVKSMLAADGDIACACYYSGTDRRTESFDSYALLRGGNGLLNREGIMKPAGFAMRLLGKLSGCVVASGEWFMVTTDRRDNYAIILHNKRKLGYRYYKTEENALLKEQILKCYEDDFICERELELSGMKNGSYQVRTQRVNARSGSVFDLWRKLGFNENLSADDIRYLSSVCEPLLQIEVVNVSTGRMPLQLVMEPNEVALIEVRKTIV